METINIIKQIQMEMSKLNLDSQDLTLNVEEDLETVLMFGDKKITHIYTDSVSVVSMITQIEDDFDFEELDNTTLFDILSSIEDYNISNEKMMDKVRDYNY